MPICPYHSCMNVDNYRFACSIPLEDKVLITGGEYIDTRTTVSEYNTTGWMRDLAPLTQGRRVHSCTSFLSASGERVSGTL